MKRRLLILLLLALWLSHSALAAFSPGLTALEKRLEQGGGIHLSLSARLNRLENLSPLSLEALAQLLPRARLNLEAAGDGQQQAALCALLLDGSPLLLYQLQQGPSGGVLRVNDQLFTAPAGQDALPDLLEGPFAHLPFPGPRFGQALSGALPGLFDALGEGKPLNQRKVIKNAGTAARQVRWQLSQEAWAARWPAFCETLAQGALLPGPGASRLKAWLRGIAVEGPADLRLFTDREGHPLGWQFIGSLSGRKVTLLTGWKQDAGLYINLKAPARKGRDSLTLRVSMRQDTQKNGRTLQGDADWSWRSGALRDAGKARLALASKDTPEGEAITGTLTWNQPALAGRPRLFTRLTPQLSWGQDGLTGTLGLARQQDRRDLLDMAVDIRLTASASPPLQKVIPAPAAAETIDEARERLRQALMEPLRQLLLTLPPDQRLALIHDMGRTARTQGEPVAPLPYAPTNSDSVKEEDNP